MAAPPTEGHVRDTDVFAWRMERDPLLRSTIVAVATFDRCPDVDVLRDRVERATRLTPTFRSRLAPSALPLGLSSPRWLLEPDLDLSWHLRHVVCPAPGTLDAVLDMARVAGMTAFDPARPLWEATLVEGLEGGRAALIMKVHHALTDGIGGIQLAAHVVDLQRQPADLGPMPPVPVADRHGGPALVGEAVAHELRRVAGAVAGGVAAVPGVLGTSLRDPVGAARVAVATATSIGRFVAPVTRTMSPVMTGRRPAWRYGALDVPFAPLRDAGHVAGGTVNDAFVAGVTGGLRRYHEHHGAPVDALRMTMPISVRGEADPEGGNRVTLVRFPVPVGEVDPVARMAEVDRRCAGLRADRAIPHSDAIAGALNLLPAWVTGGMLKHVDVLSSDVPGFPAAVYVGGAEVEGFHAFGPTIGAAANITLMSYDGTCCVGVTTDAAAVPDPDVFLACLADGFGEVLAVVGHHLPVTTVGASWASAWAAS